MSSTRGWRPRWRQDGLVNIGAGDALILPNACIGFGGVAFSSAWTSHRVRHGAPGPRTPWDRGWHRRKRLPNAAIGRIRSGELIGTPDMTRRPTVLFISQLGLKGGDDARIFCRLPGGDDETVWMRLCLSSLGLDERIDYRSVRVDHGEALPAVEGIDAVIVGGSIASVHDNEDWQLRTADFLRGWRATDRPWFGICGGHQLASVLEGGTVGVNPHGVTAGSYPVTRTAAAERHFLFDGFTPDTAVHFSNGDRVEAPPLGSTVLATRPGLLAAALDHGGNWYSVQFHPEATADLFGIVWARRDPAKLANYRPLPGTERMLLNFLTGTGVLAV